MDEILRSNMVARRCDSRLSAHLCRTSINTERPEDMGDPIYDGFNSDDPEYFGLQGVVQRRRYSPLHGVWLHSTAYSQTFIDKVVPLAHERGLDKLMTNDWQQSPERRRGNAQCSSV